MASTPTVIQASSEPPRRRPMAQARGSAASEHSPDSERTAKSLVPNTAIQACSSR
jgi:hypothetical protein